MRKYCGLIEVWKPGSKTRYLGPYPIETGLLIDFGTIAIFKIRLDGGFNRKKSN